MVKGLRGFGVEEEHLAEGKIKRYLQPLGCPDLVRKKVSHATAIIASGT
jgi:hypothetical protein